MKIISIKKFTEALIAMQRRPQKRKTITQLPVIFQQLPYVPI
jgi:hypothetical protein